MLDWASHHSCVSKRDLKWVCIRVASNDVVIGGRHGTSYNLDEVWLVAWRSQREREGERVLNAIHIADDVDYV